jgi:GT2 family glycosyltransferase
MDVTQRVTVGVLICCYTVDRLSQIREAVKSALEQTHKPDVVLVVVDGTAEVGRLIGEGLGLEDVPGTSVRVHCLGAQQGVSRARNAGVGIIGTDFVALLDDDAVAERTWLAELMAPMSNPQVLGTSGWSRPIFGGPRPGWLPEEFLWTVGCSYRGMPLETKRVRNFHGGNALLRASTFSEVGGFDPAAGYSGRWAGGSEEADFCLRAAARSGGWFMATPRAVMNHHVPASRLQWRYFLRRCYGEGVMKQSMSRRLEGKSLGPERSFATRMPMAALRCVRTRGERAQALGIVAGIVAVLCGLARGALSPGLTESVSAQRSSTTSA